VAGGLGGQRRSSVIACVLYGLLPLLHSGASFVLAFPNAPLQSNIEALALIPLLRETEGNPFPPSWDQEQAMESRFG
jgi:hypothetical protein